MCDGVQESAASLPPTMRSIADYGTVNGTGAEILLFFSWRVTFDDTAPAFGYIPPPLNTKTSRLPSDQAAQTHTPRKTMGDNLNSLPAEPVSFLLMNKSSLFSCPPHWRPIVSPV